MSWRGVFAGILALVGLEAVLRTSASATRFGGLIKAGAGAVEWFMSPAVPGIPDLTGRGTPNPLAGSGGGSGGSAGGGGGGGSW